MKLLAALLVALAPVLASQTQAQAGKATERELIIPGFEGLALPGTLTVPALAAGAKAPAVLLLPGSGPTDRDGNQPPALTTNLLKQIAARLGAEGIAVLRFDKRAAHSHRKDWPSEVERQNEFFRWEAFVGDARAALAYLRAQPEVDAARAAVLGHSEGGLIALQLGADLVGTPEAPLALVLAGTAGTSYEPLIRQQVRDSIAQQKVPEAMAKELLAQLDAAMKQVAQEGTVPADLNPGLKGLFPANATKLLRSYYQIDPLALARRFPGDVLVLQGERDAQVPAREHSELLIAALRQREHGTAELLLVANASHNLKTVTGPQDGGFQGPVVPAALDGLVAFLRKNIAR